MKILLTILLFALPSMAQIEVKYDKFKDQTIISTDRARLRSPGLQMAVKALHPGEKLTADAQVYFVFYSISSSWRFLRSHGLIVLADGERIDLGDGTRDGTISSSRYVSGVSETMIYTIDRKDLQKMAKAQSLEMKLGFLEVRLDEGDKKGIKEMAEYVGK